MSELPLPSLAIILQNYQIFVKWNSKFSLEFGTICKLKICHGDIDVQNFLEINGLKQIMDD